MKWKIDVRSEWKIEFSFSLKGMGFGIKFLKPDAHLKAQNETEIFLVHHNIVDKKFYPTMLAEFLVSLLQV